MQKLEVPGGKLSDLNDLLSQVCELPLQIYAEFTLLGDKVSEKETVPHHLTS